MIGNRGTPSDFPPSDNLRPAAALKDTGFAWGNTPGHMANMVREIIAEASEIDAERDYWCRAREEMRLHLADMAAKGRQYPPVVEEW